MGAALVPVNTFAVAYLDANAPKSQAALYIGEYPEKNFTQSKISSCRLNLMYYFDVKSLAVTSIVLWPCTVQVVLRNKFFSKPL